MSTLHAFTVFFSSSFLYKTIVYFNKFINFFLCIHIFICNIYLIFYPAISDITWFISILFFFFLFIFHNFIFNNGRFSLLSAFRFRSFFFSKNSFFINLLRNFWAIVLFKMHFSKVLSKFDFKSWLDYVGYLRQHCSSQFFFIIFLFFTEKCKIFLLFKWQQIGKDSILS